MSVGLHAFNLLSALLPNRGGFALRRGVLRAAGVAVADGVRIATGVRVYDRYLAIGADSWIGMDTRIVSCSGGHVHIGANVDIAPMCLLDSGTHELGGPERRAGRGIGNGIVVGDGCWLGMACRLLPGARLGPGCVVAAGGVVIAGEYPPNTLLGGVPARVLRQLDDHR